MIANGKPLMAGLLLAGMGIALLAQPPEPVPPAFETPEKTPAAAAESPDDSGVDAFDAIHPKHVQVQVEFVEMSHEALTKLLFMAKPGTANANKLRQQVQDMVAKNEAKVLETQIVSARSGQKATVEAIHELRYPVEVDVPTITPSAVPTKVPLPTDLLPFTPNSFETRNIGSTFEAEPTIDHTDDYVDIFFTAELVWHTGNSTWLEHRDGNHNVYKIQSPNIFLTRMNTQLTCKNGQYLLAGTVSPKDSKGEIDLSRKVMVFVKCDILTVR